MMRHQRNILIASIILSAITMGCVTITPVCRHTVLSQHAAAIDAGYTARIVTFKNTPEVYKRSGYKYHQAVEVQVNGEWGHWLPQPKVSWTTTKKQPSGIILRSTQ